MSCFQFPQMWATIEWIISIWVNQWDAFLEAEIVDQKTHLKFWYVFPDFSPKTLYQCICPGNINVYFPTLSTALGIHNSCQAGKNDSLLSFVFSHLFMCIGCLCLLSLELSHLSNLIVGNFSYILIYRNLFVSPS